MVIQSSGNEERASGDKGKSKTWKKLVVLQKRRERKSVGSEM